MTTVRGRGGWPLVGVCLALGGSPARGQLVVPTTEVAPASVRLSDQVRLTLAVEGPSPLRVDFPADAAEVLAPESRAVWRVRPTGPAAVAPTTDGREQWTRAFRLDPYGAGESVPLVFAAVKVAAGADPTPREVIWPSKEVRVQATVPDPRPEAARPVTGIEELPPPPVPPPEAVGWQVLGGLAGVFAATVVLSLVRKWRAKPPALPPGVWASAALARLGRDLAAGRAGPGDVPERVAAVLREYVERRHGVPAPKQTTPELVVGCEQAGWPADRTTPLRDILGRCDRAKFAGESAGAAEAADVLGRAAAWVAAADRPAAR